MAGLQQNQAVKVGSGGACVSKYDLGQRAAVLAEMIRALHRAHSWCGETHIQKAVYLLQSAAGVDLGYEFVLYKHGPYSYELATDIASLRSAHIVEFVIPISGYGPTVRLTEMGSKILAPMKPFVHPFNSKIKYIADWFGPQDVRSLERLATGYFVKQQYPDAPNSTLAAKLRMLKPHISEPDALSAIQQLEGKLVGLRGHNAGRRVSVA
jgi:hypothetical protein